MVMWPYSPPSLIDLLEKTLDEVQEEEEDVRNELIMMRFLMTMNRHT